jgi:AAA family ATP:ADP antiporter
MIPRYFNWLVRGVLRAKPGEERAVGFASLYFFMLMCAYYLLRPLREALTSEAGLENLPWLYTAVFFAMLAITPIFGALVARVRKQLLLPITYTFFASNLFVFYLLFKLTPDSRWLASAYFIWLSVFNFFVVSVFWSFMADVFRAEEAKRLFGPIFAGGGTGAIVGPFLMKWLLPWVGIDAVVFLAMLLLLATLPCIRVLARWAEARHGHFVLPPEDPEARIGGRIMAGMMLVARSPYLLGIVTVIAIGSIAAAFMYYELLHLVEQEYPDFADRAAFFANLEIAVSVLAWLFQGFVVAWLIRRFELQGALASMPIVALLSFVALAIVPVFGVLAAGQIVRRAGEYGIAKPSREVLFTIVDAETKYKAKNFIDTVLQRGSDVVGVWLHLVMSTAGVGLAGFAAVAGASMIAATTVSWRLGRSFERRRAGTS